MEHDLDLSTYFARIAYHGERTPNLETLRAIVLAHTRAIPFENLDPLLGRPVRLDLESLQQKLVHAQRGGYCFEHNTLLLAVLRALGYRASGLAARVRWNAPPDAMTPRSHMLLRVELEQGTHLVDVGFGGLTLTGVLRLHERGDQPTPHEPFRLDEVEEWLELSAYVQGGWRPLYRFTLERVFPADYEVSNHYTATHPSSPFTRGLMAARAHEHGRYALANDVLTSHHLDGRPSERRKLGSVHEWKAALSELFGVRLPDDAQLDARLEALHRA